MALTVRWSLKAKRTYESILNYLTENWSEKEINAFIDKVDAFVDVISKHPEAFNSSQKNENVRKAVLGRQNSLFYLIRSSEIYLLYFWDNRMDPKKSKTKLNNKNILIADDLHPVFMERAQALGFTCDYQPKITLPQALTMLPGYTGLAIRSKFRVDKQVMDTATNLKFIARAGAGMDNIDEAYAQQKGIQLLNAPEGNMDAVGEHAVGLLLALMNNFRKADRQIRHGLWKRESNRGYELKGKTVGVIGYGFMGQSFARKLSGFGVQVMAYDKYKTGFSDGFVREVSMEEIVKHADIVSLHVPLTRETNGMVDDEYLFHFKKPIFLINTARGKIVKTQAVLNAIKQGKIIGAALDVLETEKFPALAEQPWYAELVASDQVILTPHVAGWTFESYRKISEVLAEKLENISF